MGRGQRLPSLGNRKPFSIPATSMPPRRSGRRRRRGHESGEERSRSSCQEDKKPEARPASAQTMQEASLPASQAEEVAQVLQPSGTHVWEALRRHWGRTFCIRLDLQGYFHTYPDVGGPFQSLQETDKAIDHYLECSRDPKMKMCMEKDGKFSMERAVRQALYWPDGTIKKRKRSYSTDKSRNRIFLFAQALVDKYNEDNNLLKDAAHELKDVLHHQQICEKQIWYYHLNFTTKIKGSGPDNFSEDNLFFAEIKCIPHREHPELLVSCCCPINLNDNGQHCYGCTNHGNVDMKHPDSSDEFAAGHLDVHLPVGSFVESSDYDSDDDKYVKAREAKLRRM
ncbi:hypothetical protein BS78_02G298500 [Paspalum vaginatum]|nr:hypothetical protein BS78_02G298500 [Paspalum vaginatum]